MATDSKAADPAAASTAADASSAPSMGSSRMRVILGCMTFAHGVDKAGSALQLRTFAERNAAHEPRDRVELDTARMYGETGGATEQLMGKIFAEDPELRGRYIMASKCNPLTGLGDGLTPERLRTQTGEILTALGQDSVDIMYLHMPDWACPIAETLAAMDELHKAGKFKELGLSNFAAWHVAHIWHLCDANGWVKPTVFQGMYNAITRMVEPELFPCLRRYGLRFYAYNPLAGGLLTGKHRTLEADPREAEGAGRFAGDSSKAARYRQRYWKAEYFAALDVVRDACDAAGVTMANASLRWLVHHSQLKADLGDGVIIGASSQGHLEANLAATHEGPLPTEVVQSIDKAEVLARPECPKYFKVPPAGLEFH